jgi:hypothetical protein
VRERIRSHLTFPTVISLAALFVALGGTAMASVIITSNSQVAQNTISGHKPPSGKHPNIIGGSVNGQDLSAGLKSSLSLHCSNGLKPVPNQAPVLCAETSLRDSTDYVTALERCAAVNLRLPSDDELALVFQNSAAPQPQQWTSTHYFDYSNGVQVRASWLSMDASRDIALGGSPAIGTLSSAGYRCVTTPRN